VLLFLGLLALARSQWGLANAYAMWSPTHWDNPDTTDLGDIDSRASLKYQHVDPTEAARAHIVGPLPQLPYAPFVGVAAPPPSPVRPSSITRAPPSA
jgi:hypothetical protein